MWAWLTNASSQDRTPGTNIYNSQPSDCLVPATLVVVGRGSPSIATSGTNSGSGTGVGVTGAEEAISIAGSAGCGGSWVSVVCGSAGLRFLANASVIVGCKEATIWGVISTLANTLGSDDDNTFRLLCNRVMRLGAVDITHEGRWWLRNGVWGLWLCGLVAGASRQGAHHHEMFT